MAKPDDCSDFYEALGPKSAKERAAFIWRMPKGSQILVGTAVTA